MNIVPSIELIPAKYGVGTLLTQVPMDVSGDFSVTRATAVSTRYNSAGLIETIASGIPRLDYYTSSGTPGCPALLVEPAATNLVPSGLAFNSQTGVLYDTTVSDSPAVSINSARITKNEPSGNPKYGNQNCSLSALSPSTTYTISRFFKYNGVDFVTSMEFNSSPQWGGVAWRQLINIASAGVTLGGSTLCTGSVENFGNGWYRVSVRITTGATITGAATVSYLMVLPPDLSTGQGMLTALPQFETGPVATSYIPTTTGSVARNADVINLTGATNYIGQTEGTIYWDIAYVGGVLTGTGNPEFGVRNQALTNWIALTSNGPSAPFRIQARTTGAVVLINHTANITSGKAALAWSSAGLVLYVNGVQVSTSATNPNFSFSRADIGNTSTMPFKANAFAIYLNRLPNYLLESATSQIQSYSALASSLSYTVV
jgi:hypothetical protein